MSGRELMRSPREATDGLVGRDRMRVLAAAKFGRMDVIATDRGAGRLYRCACGTDRWSSWGHAEDHAQRCELADVPGAIADARREVGA
jgi:hypothetical protein